MSELISNEVVEIIAPISDRVIKKLECSDAITIINNEIYCNNR